MKKLPLLITTGEPAGIGMDIVLMLADKQKFANFNRKIIILADIKAMQQQQNQLQRQNSLSKDIQLYQLNHQATSVDTIYQDFDNILNFYKD